MWTHYDAIVRAVLTELKARRPEEDMTREGWRQWKGGIRAILVEDALQSARSGEGDG
jgi:hypothetical protein